MKKIFLCASLFLAGALPGLAQSTTVSGTITDANSQAFANGTYKIEFNANGVTPPYVWNGSPYTPTSFSGSMNSSGAFSGVSVPSTNFISGGSQGTTLWRFTVCPASTSPCFSTSLALAGATQSVTSSITPPAIQVTSGGSITAYGDSEVVGSVVGSTYFNLTDNTTHTCTVSIPCTWVSGGGAGGGTVTVVTCVTGCTVANGTTTPAITVTATGTGNVVGPGSSTTSDAAIFGDTTGKLLADGGGPLPATKANVTNQWLNTYTLTTGLFTSSQPGFSNLSGTCAISQGCTGSATAAQNSVFAGPATGGTGAPSFQTAPTFSAANLTNFPTFNQNTTGTSGGLSGSPAITVSSCTGCGSGGPGTGTLNAAAYWSSTSALGSVPLLTNQVLEGVTSSAPVAAYPGVTVNANASATPAILGDGGSPSARSAVTNTTNGTTSTAATIAAAGSTGFPAGFVTALCNQGTVVTTLTPATSTVNGNATAKLVPIASGGTPECLFLYDDGTNYFGPEILPTDSNGRLQANGFPALTGDITNAAGALATTLATVNSNVGSFTNANITVNGKGLITAASNGSGGSNAFPLTVTGGVSGAIPCFTSTTVEAAGTLLPSGDFVLGGGAGVCPSATFSVVPIANGGTGAATVAADTVFGNPTGSTAAPSFTTNPVVTTVTLAGTTATFTDYAQGTTSAAVAPCNTATSICEQAPTTVTAYLVNKPGVSANGVETNNVASAVDTQGFSGDANHSNGATGTSISTATSIGSTSLCSTANCPAGTYQINGYIDVTTACTTTGSYFVTIGYTDDAGAKTIVMPLIGTGVTASILTATGISSSLAMSSTSNFAQGDLFIRSTGAAAINYTTTAGACATGGPGLGKMYLSVISVQ